MKKAFLFDMDGVIVDTERKWRKMSVGFAESIYGKEIVEKMGDTIGVSLDHEYVFAKKHGFTMELDEYYRKFDEQAAKVYATTEITRGLEDLIVLLKEMDFTTGIVSSSRRQWIEMVLDKIGNRDFFDYTISLNEVGLPSKPSPEGYIRAMQDVGATPETTIILEDSNNGMKAGKASGAFVIGFPPNLVDGYVQNVPVDATAHSFKEVMEIIKKIQ